VTRTAEQLLAGIPALAGAEPVTRVTLPARLDYTYTPGGSQSRFLLALTERRLLAERCPSCTRVHIPARGVCPTCGVATTEQVDLPHIGTVTTFCIVNIAAKGLDIEVPYCYAYVLLDGAHVGLHARIGGIPHDQVHVGQRVEPVWREPNDVQGGPQVRPSLAAISHFRPTGDPDADPETYLRWM
jgi:uncharacterized OB-fold protein